MRINITDNIAEIDYKKGKRNFSKTITIDSLVEAFTSHQSISTPLLPAGVRYYSKKDSNITMIIEIPPMRRKIGYLNNAGKSIFEGVVPLPWGAMRIDLIEQADGKFKFSYGIICALKRPITTFDDPVFHFPAPNIYEDFHICWGSTFSDHSSSFNSLMEVGRILELYFSSNFNTHVSPRMHRYERYEDMLRAIQGHKVFDKSLLVSAGRTVADLL